MSTDDYMGGFFLHSQLHAEIPALACFIQCAPIAERFLQEWRDRMRKFGLELHPDETRLI